MQYAEALLESTNGFPFFFNNVRNPVYNRSLIAVMCSYTPGLFKNSIVAIAAAVLNGCALYVPAINTRREGSGSSNRSMISFLPPIAPNGYPFESALPKTERCGFTFATD